MPKIMYVNRNFSQDSLKTIRTADAICQDYARQGLTLTLRQLYYRFVAQGLIPNKDTEYKRLGSILNDARLAGLLDWRHMEDRTRNLRGVSHYDNPGQVIEAAAYSYRNDKWASQPQRVEVWIEKDALVGVIEQVCRTNDVDFFSCRGYTSASEVWSAGQRMALRYNAGQATTILHLGDHDPSGMDMSRDIADRLRLFTSHHTGSDYAVDVQRIALNFDQIQQYAPPPNPAKLTDSRAEGYISQYGDESWELDALEPSVIVALIQGAIDQIREPLLWQVAQVNEQIGRDHLTKTAAHWPSVANYVEGLDEDEPQLIED